MSAIFCDGDDGECGAWTTDDWTMGVSTVGGVKITREQPSPGWQHVEAGDEDFCPEHRAVPA